MAINDALATALLLTLPQQDRATYEEDMLELADLMLMAWDQEQHRGFVQRQMRTRTKLLQRLCDQPIVEANLELTISYLLSSEQICIHIQDSKAEREVRLKVPFALSSSIDARHSMGFIQHAETVQQDHSTHTTNTQGGDVSSGDFHKTNIANYFAVAGNAGRLTNDQLQKLSAIIDEQEWSVLNLQESYKASTPFMWPETRFKAENAAELLSQMVLDLNTAPRQHNGTFPILRFLRTLLPLMSEQSIQVKLDQWIKSLAIILGESDAESPAEQVSRSVVYILLILEKDASQSDKYLVSVRWTTEHTGPYEILEFATPDQDQRYTLDEIPTLLSFILNDKLSAVMIQANNNVVIEWMVPAALLTTAIEHWNSNVGVEDDDWPWPVGLRHPVIVRLLERARNPKWQLPLLGHRQWFRNLANQPFDPVVWMCSDMDCERTHLFGKLQGDGGCLASTHALEALSDERFKGLRQALLRAGTPAAILPRRWACDPANVHDVIAGLVQIGGGLLHVIHKQRAAVISNEGHPLQHMTILWDDPNRLPRL